MRDFFSGLAFVQDFSPLGLSAFSALLLLYSRGLAPSFLESGAKLLPFWDSTKYFGKKVINFQNLRTLFDKILAIPTLHLHFVTCGWQNLTHSFVSFVRLRVIVTKLLIFALNWHLYLHICKKNCNFAAESCKDLYKSTMTKEEKVAYWLDLADYDIETAEAMYKTKRWLYVAFMCHQVIEKTIKAYWSFLRDDIPPYTHNHMRLAEGCGLYEQMNEEQKTFLEIITNYNIEARYPENKAELAHTLTPNVCKNLIDNTKNLQRWIKDKLSITTKL